MAEKRYFLKDWNAVLAQISIMFSDSQTWRRQNFDKPSFHSPGFYYHIIFLDFQKIPDFVHGKLNILALCKEEQVKERRSLGTYAWQKQWPVLGVFAWLLATPGESKNIQQKDIQHFSSRKTANPTLSVNPPTMTLHSPSTLKVSGRIPFISQSLKKKSL